MSGVGIICFTASYAVALCLELTRFLFRSPIRNAFILCWILAGLAAHTAYLYYQHSVSVVPIDGAESYFLVSAWGLVLVYLYLFCFHAGTPSGLVFLPITLLLIGGAILVPGNVPDETLPGTIAASQAEIGSLWKRIHTSTFFLATLSVCIGFVAGLAYLIQDRRLRSKRAPMVAIKLPTLEWSLMICRRMLGAAMLLLGACILSGLNLRPTPSAISPTDPLILGTFLMFVFLLLFSGILSAGFLKKEGRYVAWLTFFAFLFLVCMLLLSILFSDAHWKRMRSFPDDRSADPARKEVRQ